MDDEYENTYPQALKMMVKLEDIGSPDISEFKLSELVYTYNECGLGEQEVSIETVIDCWKLIELSKQLTDDEVKTSYRM